MALVINDGCVSCGACAGECPVGAISEGDGKYEIKADDCIDCGSCAGTSLQVLFLRLTNSKRIEGKVLRFAAGTLFFYPLPRVEIKYSYPKSQL